MDKTIDSLCEEIDALLLHSLELMEEKISTTVQMEQILKNGHIELAKSRYILGKENVSILQVPVNKDDDMIPLFNLETTSVDGTAGFDISTKKSDKTTVNLKDPIKWFGILVPQNLKTAQKYFQDTLYLAVKIANIQSELIATSNKMHALFSLKKVTDTS